MSAISGRWSAAWPFAAAITCWAARSSALDGVGPEQLNIASLIRRASDPAVKEIVLATGATVDGQTTAHYIADRLAELPVSVTRLAHGLPVGGELDYLDDGTLTAALKADDRCSGYGRSHGHPLPALPPQSANLRFAGGGD